MIWLLMHVQGQTEKEFVTWLLCPHFFPTVALMFLLNLLVQPCARAIGV